jgi:predicted Rossmann fold flavoprotein
MEVAVIGGGASGIACAAAVKKQNKNIGVTVYERMPRILKKILVTGNGRCNLTNIGSSEKYFRGDTDVLQYAFSKYPPKSNIEFFNSMGLLTRTEAQGRVYPVSGQASAVVNALLCECERAGVKVLTDTEITEVRRSGSGFLLNGKYKADKLVIASGGSAARAQGTDGGSFRLLKSLGVDVKSPVPALTGVIIDGFPKSVKGVRNICTAELFVGRQSRYAETGEVQFNDYGVSGIPIMQLSGIVAENTGKNLCLTLDFLPDTDKAELTRFLFGQKKQYPEKSAEEWASGVLPKALGNYVLALANIRSAQRLCDIADGKIRVLSDNIKRLELKPTGVRGFEYAQVTSGGVPKNEMNLQTLECKKVKNLYVTGEAVNVYGLCGGHNLQWAWSSGRLCADAILKENTVVKNK